MVDLLVNFLNYSSVALISSADSYGSSGAQAFVAAAEALRDQGAVNLKLAVTASFERGTSAFPAALVELAQSGARVIVLFCHEGDAVWFMRAAFDTGMAGGEGYLWLASDGVVSGRIWESGV